MKPPDRSHASSPVAAKCRALAGVKAHPVAAALAILTLALAIIAAAGESRHTPPARTAVGGTHAAGPQRVAPTVPATSASAVAHGAEPRATASASRKRDRRAAAPRGQRTGRALWPRGALSAARRFLRTYLPFTYGQLPARAIQAAAPSLRARIAANPPQVPAAIRRLRPRVTALAIIPARIIDAGARWAATATVSDRQETYHVIVTLDQQHGHWLVTAILTPSD
jgi:hypothetical protein